MIAPSLSVRWSCLVGGALIAALVLSPDKAIAADPAVSGPVSSDSFDALLEAGEFAPALAVARAAEDAQQRDSLLARLAAAQAQAGGRDAAFHTLAAVESDLRRSDAIEATKDLMPAAGARGGSQADFDSLMELITTTVRPQTWDEVGGPGSISPFQNGVYVDAQGVLRRQLASKPAAGLAVARLAALSAADNVDPRLRSPLRKVSLTRLEKHVQLALAAGRQPSAEMRNLAGLERIQYVLVYPETGDLVLAGPAGSWHTDDEGRHVSRHSGRPIVQLDDLVVLLRQVRANPNATFACSINPTQQGLARTRQFAAASSSQPLKPGARSAWLKKLRDSMGRQTISVEGLDPRTRVARVLVEADYRMKLVGMGLEEGTVDVPSYLDLLHVKPGEAPPPLDVLRWWFTLKYDQIWSTPDRDAFELRGQGVQVLSENELLTQLGHRVHTGQSTATNQEFANRFTQHFDGLAAKYPVYADLQNIFDLAIVAALIEQQGLCDRVDWHQTCFGDPQQYVVALGNKPESVETVINHRRIGGKHLVVGVSGGVRAEPARYVQEAAIRNDPQGRLPTERLSWASGELPLDAWWWD